MWTVGGRWCLSARRHVVIIVSCDDGNAGDHWRGSGLIPFFSDVVRVPGLCWILLFGDRCVWERLHSFWLRESEGECDGSLISCGRGFWNSIYGRDFVFPRRCNAFGPRHFSWRSNSVTLLLSFWLQVAVWSKLCILHHCSVKRSASLFRPATKHQYDA